MTAPELLARRFHNLYEHMAPQFGYTTREDTRLFIPESPNGKLMIAVCEALASSPEVAARIAEARREGWNAAKEASEGAIETMLRGIDKMLAEIWGGSRRADRLRSKREQLIFAITAIRALKEETP